MASRYLTGLGLAFLLIGGVLATTVVIGSLLSGRPPQMRSLVDVWLAFSIPTLALLAFVVGPAVLLMRRRLGETLTALRAATLGAAIGPLSLIAIWLLFREANETLGGLFAFWSRLPTEFLVGVLPHAAAGALFAGWLASGRASGRRQAA